MKEPGLTRYQNYLRFLRVKLEEREDVKLYLELLLTLSAISFFTWFAIRPTFATIVTLVKQIQIQEETAQTLDQKLKNLEAANRERPQFEKDRIIVDQAMPDGEGAAAVSRQIEALSSREGVALTNMSIEKLSEDPAPAKIKKLAVAANVSGQPQKIMSFITQLGKTRRPLLWETLSLIGKPPGAAGTLELSFTGAFPFVEKERSE